MSKTISNFIKLAPPGTKAVNALVQYELKGREIAATPPVGTKPAPKDLSLIGLLDASQIDPTSPLADERSYEVLGGSSMVTLEASKRDLADTKAVLVINGTVTKDPPNFRYLEDDEASQPLIKSFGDQPGLIVKVCRVMSLRATHLLIRSQLLTVALSQCPTAIGVRTSPALPVRHVGRQERGRRLLLLREPRRYRDVPVERILGDDWMRPGNAVGGRHLRGV